MQVSVIRSAEHWDACASDWNRLANNNPMLRHEWLGAWWRHYGDGHELHILAVTDGDTAVGFVPCYVHRGRLGTQIRFLGSGAVCSDYLTAIVDPLRREPTLTAIHEYLVDQFQANRFGGSCLGFHLDGCTETDPWTMSLVELARTHGFSRRTITHFNAWRFQIPSTLAEFYGQRRGRNSHRKAKKAITRFQSGELVATHLTDPADLDHGMATLRRLHQARRASLGDSGCFADPRFEPFLRDAVGQMIAVNAAKFLILEHQSRAIGIHLQLIAPGTLMMYQSGADPAWMSLEPGHALVTAAVLWSLEHGIRNFDFLRGDEPYKEFWGGIPEPIVHHTLAPPSIKAQSIESLQRGITRIRSGAKGLSSLFALPDNRHSATTPTPPSGSGATVGHDDVSV